MICDATPLSFTSILLFNQVPQTVQTRFKLLRSLQCSCDLLVNVLTGAERRRSLTHSPGIFSHMSTFLEQEEAAGAQPYVNSQSVDVAEDAVVRLDTTKRHQDYWFEDGNTVLLVGDIAFRVHRGILSRNSPVFRDLFKVPQEATQEKMDGCPVVRLSDHGAEVAALLGILYDGSRLLQPDEPLPFSVVAAAVRLGHKYQMDGLVKSAISRLKTCFPDNFDDWENIVMRGKTLVTMAVEDAISVVNLARLTETLIMLPVALYRCCVLPTDVLLSGLQRPDGSIERL